MPVERAKQSRGAALGPRGLLAAAALLAAGASPVAAQKLFKYRDADGVWVFTDRQPAAGQAFEQREIARRLERPEVQLFERSGAAGIELVARSTYFGPVQIAYRLSETENVAAGTPREALTVLAPRSETSLATVRRADPGADMRFRYDFAFLPGDPAAEHRPEQPYRLPFALSSAFTVSQAFPDVITHTDPSSRYAIDFEMPVGTNVFAARAGVVLEVASDFFEAGLDPAVDGPRANIVRVLHDDGTMALYGHLNWNSIRVVPGQRVERGQYLADSGNTGFSTGPHLHFVVQRNRGGAIVSLPVEFAGADGQPLSVRTGERYAAH